MCRGVRGGCICGVSVLLGSVLGCVLFVFIRSRLCAFTHHMLVGWLTDRLCAAAGDAEDMLVVHEEGDPVTEVRHVVSVSTSHGDTFGSVLTKIRRRVRPGWDVVVLLRARRLPLTLCVLCVPRQLSLPETMRLRGWIGTPNPTVLILPEDSLHSVSMALHSVNTTGNTSDPRRVLVEVRRGGVACVAAQRRVSSACPRPACVSAVQPVASSEPEFPSTSASLNADPVEWVFVGHFYQKFLTPAYVALRGHVAVCVCVRACVCARRWSRVAARVACRLAERAVLLPFRAADVLETVVTAALSRLGRSLSYMLMPERGLHALRVDAERIDYAVAKGRAVLAVPTLFLAPGTYDVSPRVSLFGGSVLSSDPPPLVSVAAAMTSTARAAPQPRKSQRSSSLSLSSEGTESEGDGDGIAPVPKMSRRPASKRQRRIDSDSDSDDEAVTGENAAHDAGGFAAFVGGGGVGPTCGADDGDEQPLRADSPPLVAGVLSAAAVVPAKQRSDSVSSTAPACVAAPLPRVAAPLSAPVPVVVDDDSSEPPALMHAGAVGSPPADLRFGHRQLPTPRYSDPALHSAPLGLRL